MSFLIQTLDGIIYDLTQSGLKPIRLEIDSPSPRTERETIDGADGHIDIDTMLEGRNIRASFLIEAHDFKDFHLVRHSIFRLFNAKSMFFIIDSRLPHMRWKVRTSTSYSIERINPVNGLVTIEMLSPSPYGESYGTTLSPYNYNGELWQIGIGLEAEDLMYSHSTQTFRIYNGSDIPVDPRQFPLKIQFAGESDNLAIRNVDTGDEWTFNGSSVEGDTILLDGIRSFKNNTSIFGQTNRKLITLQPGLNEFEVSGTSGPFTISFDFKFYYL